MRTCGIGREGGRQGTNDVCIVTCVALRVCTYIPTTQLAKRFALFRITIPLRQYASIHIINTNSSIKCRCYRDCTIQTTLRDETHYCCRHRLPRASIVNIKLIFYTCRVLANTLQRISFLFKIRTYVPGEQRKNSLMATVVITNESLMIIRICLWYYLRYFEWRYFIYTRENSSKMFFFL